MKRLLLDTLNRMGESSQQVALMKELQRLAQQTMEPAGSRRSSLGPYQDQSGSISHNQSIARLSTQRTSSAAILEKKVEKRNENILGKFRNQYNSQLGPLGRLAERYKLKESKAQSPAILGRKSSLPFGNSRSVRQPAKQNPLNSNKSYASIHHSRSRSKGRRDSLGRKSADGPSPLTYYLRSLQRQK